MTETPAPVTPRSVPRTLLAAGALVAVQAVGLMAIAGWLIVGILREPPKDEHAIAWSTAIFLLVAGLLVAFLAYALLFGRPWGRRWTRGPVVVLELLALPIGWQFLDGSSAFGGALSIMVAAVVLVLMLTRSATAVFGDSADSTNRRE